MNRFNIILVSILAVQLVLSASLYFSGDAVSDRPQQEALLETPIESVERITIADADGNQSVVKKKDGQWQLADYHQLPANQNSVNNMLSLLQKTETGWPVATTESSRERFKLAEDEFNKKVVLGTAAGSEQTLYLGTSPGFRQLHVRRSGDDEIYAVKLNNHDFPAKNTELLDKTLLQLAGEIDMIKGPDFEFRRQGDNWTLENPQGKVNEEPLTDLTNTLARLLIQGADTVPQDMDDPFELSLRAQQKDYVYRLFKKDDKHFIHRNDQQLAFNISKFEYDRITGQNAESLISKETTKDEEMVSEEQSSQPSGNMTESSSQPESEEDQNQG